MFQLNYRHVNRSNTACSRCTSMNILNTHYTFSLSSLVHFKQVVLWMVKHLCVWYQHLLDYGTMIHVQCSFLSYAPLELKGFLCFNCFVFWVFFSLLLSCVKIFGIDRLLLCRVLILHTSRNGRSTAYVVLSHYHPFIYSFKIKTL